MSIASALTALQTDITNARTAITTKGGTVTSGGGSSQLATDIASIPSGASISPFEMIDFTPASAGSVMTFVIPNRPQAFAFAAVDEITGDRYVKFGAAADNFIQSSYIGRYTAKTDHYNWQQNLYSDGVLTLACNGLDFVGGKTYRLIYVTSAGE